VFGKLGEAGINAQETENIIFGGAVAAIARINLDKEVPAEIIASIKDSCPQIMHMTVVPLGGVATV
jgi:D-3-phosphoglycerate dehydrogenase